LGGEAPSKPTAGFGAMRITGQGIWGPPRDESEAIALLRRVVDRGVTFIDTADSYGPGISETLIAKAVYPYPAGLVVATKGGLTRPGADRWVTRLSARAFAPRLRRLPEKAEARAHRALPATRGRSPDTDRGFGRCALDLQRDGKGARLSAVVCLHLPYIPLPLVPEAPEGTGGR
jgi:Aldo/keto reductase family